MRVTSTFSAAALLLAAGCGGSYSSPSPAPAPAAPGFFITVSAMTFSPLDLHVPPGGTVTVLNADGMTHSVTSEATPNAFVPGSVSGIAFDTGLFRDTRTFTLPSNAPSGTVIPYYCRVHTNTMVTPNGTITVDPSAVATTPPPGSGGPMGGGGGY